MLSFIRTFVFAFLLLTAIVSAAPVADFNFKELSSTKSHWKEIAAKWQGAGAARFRKAWLLHHSRPSASHIKKPEVPHPISKPATSPAAKPPPPPASAKPSPPPAPKPSPPPATKPSPLAPAKPEITPTTQSGSSSSTAIAAYLQAHNAERAKHNAKPLKWSTALAKTAADWGRGCKFTHSKGKYGSVGENLASGTGDFGISKAMKLWNDEAGEYNPNQPQASHWTQVVWKGTTEIGCAAVTCPAGAIFDKKFGPATYYVCQYSQPGNVIGSFKQNIDV